MMRLTPRQLKQIKDQFPAQDDNVILLAILYLDKNAFHGAQDAPELPQLTALLTEVFSVAAPSSEIIQELRLIIKKYLTVILPVINHLQLNTITNSEAATLCAKLMANSAFAFITSEDEIAFPTDPVLQGLNQILDHVLDANNYAEPEQITFILTNLFEKFPETGKISAFNDLSLQAKIIADDREQENILVGYTKEKLTLQKNIDASYLSDALAAFKQWKKNHRNYLGALRKIAEQADRLTGKYPSAKKQILEFCYLAFHNMLVDKDFLPVFFAKFADVVSALIELKDKQLAYSLCFHIANGNSAFSTWTLIEIFDHRAFKQFSLSERRVLFNVITTSLNNNVAIDNTHLRLLLEKCVNPDARRVLLQCLNAFFLRTPFPSLATLIDWIQPVADNDIRGLANTLAENYLAFNQPNKIAHNPNDLMFEKQLNKLRHDLEAYAQTSFTHTRKARAAYLYKFGAKQLSFIDTKTSEEKQSLLQQTIAELYLHYATIEDASGILSRALEKRLIKLLQIPKDDNLIAAINRREQFSYKLHNFFCAGRGFFKRYRDKAKDPVHDIIWQHLNPAIKSQIKHLQNEILQLDQLDRLETTLFSSSLPEERLGEIGEKIAQRNE